MPFINVWKSTESFKQNMGLKKDLIRDAPWLSSGLSDLETRLISTLKKVLSHNLFSGNKDHWYNLESMPSQTTLVNPIFKEVPVLTKETISTRNVLQSASEFAGKYLSEAPKTNSLD